MSKYEKIFDEFLGTLNTPKLLFTLKDLESLKIPRSSLYRILKKKKEEKVIGSDIRGYYYKLKLALGKYWVGAGMGEYTTDITKWDTEQPEGYITGYKVFSGFNLTTQNSAIYKIAMNRKKKNFVLNGVRVEFVKTKAPITKENVRLLMILDCIQEWNNIMDSKEKSLIRILGGKVQNSTEFEKQRIVELSKYYKKETRERLEMLMEIKL